MPTNRPDDEAVQPPENEPKASAETLGFEADLTSDHYYRGTIVKLHEGSQRGVIRSASGRNIPFSFMFLSMRGPHRLASDLRVGMEVGYDVSHTSHGLRVSVIRLPD